VNHRQIRDDASERSWLSPSYIKTQRNAEVYSNASEKPDELPTPDSDDSAFARGRAASNIGSAVHATLQRMLEVRDADLSEIAAAEAERHGVKEETNEVIRLTRATLRTPLLKRLAELGGEDVWVETPVAVSIPTADGSSTVLEGRVDLIYRIDDERLGIADFKTDRMRQRSIDEMAEPYIPQLGAYAYAVQKSTGLRVAEAGLIFSRLSLDSPGAGEFMLDDVAAAIQMALKLASNGSSVVANHSHQVRRR